MREQLANGYVLLAILREFGPVSGDAIFIIEIAARVRQRHGEPRETFGGGKDKHHGVLFPWLAHLLVAQSAPEVDDLFVRNVSRASRPHFVALGEVAFKLFTYQLKTRSGVAVNFRRIV